MSRPPQRQYATLELLDRLTASEHLLFACDCAERAVKHGTGYGLERFADGLNFARQHVADPWSDERLDAVCGEYSQHHWPIAKDHPVNLWNEVVNSGVNPSQSWSIDGLPWHAAGVGHFAVLHCVSILRGRNASAEYVADLAASYFAWDALNQITRSTDREFMTNRVLQLAETIFDGKRDAPVEVESLTFATSMKIIGDAAWCAERQWQNDHLSVLVSR